jgi:hypothetical protein
MSPASSHRWKRRCHTDRGKGLVRLCSQGGRSNSYTFAQQPAQLRRDPRPPVLSGPPGLQSVQQRYTVLDTKKRHHPSRFSARPRLPSGSPCTVDRLSVRSVLSLGDTHRPGPRGNIFSSRQLQRFAASSQRYFLVPPGWWTVEVRQRFPGLCHTWNAWYLSAQRAGTLLGQYVRSPFR